MKHFPWAALLFAGMLSAQEAPDKAPSFEAVSSSGGSIAFPADYKGRIVMLDFWATWCGPCIAELPNLTKVYADLNPHGFEVLGISLDSGRTKEGLAAFARANGMAWKQICDGRGWDAELGRLYGVRAIPSCFLVDGTTGKLIAKGSELRGKSLRPTVEKALGLPQTGAPQAEPTMPAAPSAPAKPSPADPLLELAAKAVLSGKFLDHKGVREQLKQPLPGMISLQSESSGPKSSRDIAKVARAAHLRAGWYFRCTKCDKMHLNMGGAYAVAPDVVATANHVVEPPKTLLEGWLVVADENNEVFATSAILGADARADAVLVRVVAGTLKPLALRADVELGEPAFCFSDPLRRRGYFSAGIVNRLFSTDAGEDPSAQRLNVSTDWAQGSSGSAILDEFGNIIGHVARIETFTSNPPPSTGTTLVMHEAIPSRTVLNLVKRVNEAAKR